MRRKVLIVEDEVINAMSLAEVIARWGCQVVGIATSGEEAIKAAEDKKPDITLMDICIHGKRDGLSAAREIMGRLGVRVILMTGYDDEKTIREAEDLRPLAFMVKPLDMARLKELLRGD